MDNIFTAEIKDLMKDFIQCDYKKTEKNVEISLYKIINPNLLGYIFSEILNYEVTFRPFEKVNYHICFSYNGQPCSVAHYKLRYVLSIPKKYENKITEILKKVNVLIEEAFIEYSKIAIPENRYSLPNNISYYKQKEDFLEDKIERQNRQKDKLYKNLFIFSKNEKESNSKQIMYIDGKLIQVNRKISKSYRNISLEMSYTIEMFIDNFYSYIEHFFTLLYPLTENFDENEEFNKFMFLDWRKKIEIVFVNKEVNVMLDKLSEIKEKYRNRTTHGMFSKEKNINIQIPKFGLFPLWVGKKYLKGFKGVSNNLDFNDFKEVKRVFKQLTDFNLEHFPFQCNVIFNGIPIILKKEYYKNAFNSEEDNHFWINRYFWEIDNMNNMDW